MSAGVFSVYGQLPDRKRTLTAEELARTVRRQCPNVRAEESVEKAVEEALAEAGSEDVVLAFGSLSYLGQVKEAVERLGKSPGRSLIRKEE